MAAEIDERTQYDWFNEARIHELKKEFDKALAAYDEAIKIDPEFAKAWFYKAKLLQQMGQIDKAKECAKKVMELEPKWAKHLAEFLPDES